MSRATPAVSARSFLVMPASSSSCCRVVARSRRSTSARRSAAASEGCTHARMSTPAAHRRLIRAPFAGTRRSRSSRLAPRSGRIVTGYRRPRPCGRRAAPAEGRLAVMRPAGPWQVRERGDRRGVGRRDADAGERATCRRQAASGRRRAADEAAGAARTAPNGNPRYLRRYPRNERLPFGGCAPRRDAATLREPVEADGTIGVGSLGLLPGSQSQPRRRRRDVRRSPRHRAPARPRAPGRNPPRAASLAPCRP